MASKPEKKQKALFAIVCTLVLAVIATGVVIAFWHHGPKATPGTIKTVNTQTATPHTPANNSTASTNTTPASSDKSSVGNQSITGTSLTAPYGTFVSNHWPGQNGSNLTELSQCTTTPGATCYIQFTQGTVVRTLPTKMADSSGSILWEWNVNDAGLTSGTWTIKAIASLGGQTKSTSDQQNIEIQ